MFKNVIMNAAECQHPGRSFVFSKENHHLLVKKLVQMPPQRGNLVQVELAISPAPAFLPNSITSMNSPAANESESLRLVSGKKSMDSVERVYLVDDDLAVLKVVATMLHISGYEVRAYSSPAEFLEDSERLLPGVVITDQVMLGIAGIEVQRCLKARSNHFKVILITAFPTTSLAVEAMKNGAVTVLDKPFERKELLAAVSEGFRQLKNADSFDESLPPALPAGQSYLDRLSVREREVINMIYRGATNKATGIQLGISAKTVEKHRSGSMKKLQVSSLASLIRLIDRDLGNK